jgi:hypothetical protein
MHDTVIPIAWFIAASLLIGYAATGEAHADPTPTAIDYTIINHDRVCNVLDQHPTVDGVTGVVVGIVGEGLTYSEAGQVVGMSVIGWCPHHEPLLHRFIAAYTPQGVKV